MKLRLVSFQLNVNLNDIYNKLCEFTEMPNSEESQGNIMAATNEILEMGKPGSNTFNTPKVMDFREMASIPLMTLDTNIAEYLHEGDYVVYDGCDGRVTQVVNKYIQVTFTSGDLDGYEIIKHQEAWKELDFKFYFHKQVVDKYRKLYPNETDPKLINAILHNLKVKKAKAINDRYEKSKKEALKRLNREFKSAKIKKEL